MSFDEVKAAQYLGKEAFETYDLADRVAKRTVARGKRKGAKAKGYGKARPYRCPHCGKWHWGTGDGR
jgi:hypothetical protein